MKTTFLPETGPEKLYKGKLTFIKICALSHLFDFSSLADTLEFALHGHWLEDVIDRYPIFWNDYEQTFVLKSAYHSDKSIYVGSLSKEQILRGCRPNLSLREIHIKRYHTKEL